MQNRPDTQNSTQYESDFVLALQKSRFVFGVFWAILFVFSFLVAGPWAGFHGVLLACVGLLMLLRPPAFFLPRHWWLLGASFVLAGSAAFLPVDWFGTPNWRQNLTSLGVETGTMVAIQAHQAVEMLAVLGIMLFTSLWLAGHRASSSQLRTWALVFTIGVACYSLLSRSIQTASPPAATAGLGHFGFFPNRNHSATYLAMGSICGLGCLLQAIRDKSFIRIAIALITTCVCLWAIAAWSISRAGVVLVAIGCLLWLPMLGRRYLGRNGLWAIGLLSLTAIGLFFIVDSEVKERLTTTVEKAGVAFETIAPADAVIDDAPVSAGHDIDFRIPTALDTVGLIREFKWTGVGAGQFRYIFPQYRKLTAVANESDQYHPESDWLWMAAETGLPATFILLALVLLAFRKSLVAILLGRDRALRSACLVAAMLVPIHGVFDVPGHRITLAWSAAFLFALSLQIPSGKLQPTQQPLNWPFRGFALALMGAAAFLIRAQWFEGSQPASMIAENAYAQARQLYQNDKTLKQESDSTKTPYDPPPANDSLLQALGILHQSHAHAPLSRTPYRLEGMIALHFDDQDELARHAFAIERALDPTWVNAAMQQASAWSNIDPKETVKLWEVALGQARRLDQTHRLQSTSQKSIQRIIDSKSKKVPALGKAWRTHV